MSRWLTRLIWTCVFSEGFTNNVYAMNTFLTQQYDTSSASS